jgi:hypothetical protein
MPPLMRSNEEAHLYLTLNPCPCGGQDAHRDSGVRIEGETWIVRYTCVCEQCGRSRVAEFRQADEPVRPPAGSWSVGEEPSELVDAGEWLAVSDLYAGAPGSPEGLDEAQRRQAREDLLSAAAAVREALKFFADDDTLPREALWSERGLRLYDADPGRFDQERLESLRRTYLSLAGEFA